MVSHRNIICLVIPKQLVYEATLGFFFSILFSIQRWGNDALWASR